ncbi:ATP-grasp domain-containing protein [Paucibacter sp. XJ19-41]|uniref:ATP-grasp domain-containing protein n=1 Tax=Paucibacter sp. XJ19-41 TaxID=2927824 RepID=UPI0023490BF8|nr:ATP-grasp domain-containing protein [Paucibacter sp. XJ19-41]MDC6167156.1 ATP-grasp domain-containing protein [Paucibacter sp. XJ19-41]
MNKRILLIATGDTHALFDLSGACVLETIDAEIVAAIEPGAAKKLGDRSGVSVLPTHFGDLSRNEPLLDQLHAVHEAAPFDGVVTIDERCVELAASVRSKLGIPGVQPELALRFRDKVEMKRIVQAAGLRVPHYTGGESQADALALLRQHGRLVVKPRSGYGSRGVHFVSNPDELAAAWTQAQVEGDFEAEEYIDGVLYHTNSIVLDGEVLFTAVAPYIPGMGNIDYARGTPFVTASLTEGVLLDRLREFSRQVIEALGIERAVTHMEVFVTPGEEIVFCEVAIRPGGGGIVQMIEAQYGIHIARAAIQLECGADKTRLLAGLHSRPGVMGLVGMRSIATGFVRQVPSAAEFVQDWIRQKLINVQTGQFLAPSAHCTDFTGRFVIECDDHADFARKTESLQQQFDAALMVAPL